MTDEPRAAAPPSRWAVWLSPSRIVAFAVMASIPVKLLSERISDPDLWWHLKTGELIWSHRSIPSVDPFSFTAPGEPWVVQEWGSELILLAFRGALGLYGILAFRALVLFAIYALVARMIVKRMGSGMGAWALIGLTAYAGAANWTERPNLLSFLLFVVTLRIVERDDARVWWFVPLAAVWANLHGMVILGIGLVFLVAATEGLKILLGWEGADPARARRLGMVGAAGVIATMANPQGPGLLTHAFSLIGNVSSFVSEWATPSFHSAGPMVFLALLLLTIVGLALSPQRKDPTDVALVLAFTVLTLQAGRNLAVSSIVLGVVCARYLPDALRSIPRRPPTRADVAAGSSVLLGAMGLAVAAGGLAAVLAAGFPRSDRPDDIVEEGYPIESIDALGRPGVRVFAHDGWSGMIVDRGCGPVADVEAGCPRARVFVDLRWDFYGPEISSRYGQVVTARPEWSEHLDGACTTHVLVRPNDPITQVLRLSPDWRIEREDRVVRDGSPPETRSITFVRKTPAPGCARYPIPG